MKKRYITALLAIALVLTGCGSTYAASSSSEESVTTEEATEESANQLVLDDGDPWIDYSLLENIKGSEQAEAKDDFYQHVNYEWLKTAEIKPGNTSAGAFKEVKERQSQKGYQLLDDESLKSHDAALVKDFYHSIMDWDSRNETGMKDAEQVVNSIRAIKTMEELSDFLLDPDASYGTWDLMDLYVEPDMKNTEMNIAALESNGSTAGAFILSDAAEYTERTSLGERYYKARKTELESLMTRVGYTKEEADQIFEDNLQFEAKLAEAAFTEDDIMSYDYEEASYNPYKLSELGELTKNFPLADYLKANDFGSASVISIHQPELIKKFDSLYTEENLEQLKNYLIITYLRSNAPHWDEEAYDATVEANNTIYGTSGRQEYKEVAYNAVMTYLNTPLAKTYLEKYDKTETKERITKVIDDVIAGYREMLTSEDWLGEETREKAIEKLDAMRINAVYPDKWEDYSGLDLEGLSYYEALKAIDTYDGNLIVSKIDQKVDHEIWSVNVLAVNSYYDPMENSINIILGIIDDPFYRDDMSIEEVYGGIGSVIGHEISHAFDTSGAQFDKNGNMENWWTEEDLEAFNQRADKLIAYFDGITVLNGQNIRGRNVSGEAIADIGGMKVLLQMAKQQKDFDYDKFFSAYANITRTAITPEVEQKILLADSHPAYFVRANTTVQQFEEFYETYGVEEGDGMYLAPEERVSVW